MIKYTKMTGSGNDFIIINNFDKKLNIAAIESIIPKLCARGLSIGADGLIIIEPTDEADFIWRFYNADGTLPTMCGNGSRCAARFAYLNGLAGKNMSFITLAGRIEAEIKDGVNVKVQLTDPFDLKLQQPLNVAGYSSYDYINTGTQHAVVFENDIENAEITTAGRKIRYSDLFQPHGTNVNFIKIIDNKIRLRTYEKGVENETLACGTGATAAALICIERNLLKSPVTVLTSGKIDLIITKSDNKVYLEGEARVITTGEICNEAYKY